MKIFLIRSTICLFALLGHVAGQAPKPIASATGLEPFDVIIKNGKIIDGSGNPWYSSDLGIRGDYLGNVTWL